MTAYTYFLRARQLFHEFTEASLRRALELFERAVSIDASYARAYVGLAECQVALGNHGYEPFADCINRGKGFLQKALSIDEELAEAHAALSSVYMMEDDNEGAEIEARKAIELNPSLASAYFWLGGVEHYRNLDESVRLAERAHQLDPLEANYAIVVGYCYFYQGRDSEAMQQWAKTKEFAPGQTYSWMTHYYVSKGDVEKAAETVAMLEKVEPTRQAVFLWKGYLAALRGEREGAMEMIRLLKQTSKKGSALTINYIGFIHFALGDIDTFFEYMNRAADNHEQLSHVLMYSPLFAKARTDPRMRALFEKAGIPPTASPA